MPPLRGAARLHLAQTPVAGPRVISSTGRKPRAYHRHHTHASSATFSPERG